MKKSKISPIALALVSLSAVGILSCSKNELAAPIQHEDTRPITVKVIEYGTGNPINGAKVNCSTCINSGWSIEADCHDIYTTYTGGDGKCKIPVNKFRYPQVSKEGYMGGSVNSYPSGDSAYAILIPLGIVKAHIHSSGGFTPGTLITLSTTVVANPGWNPVELPSLFLPISATDTTLYFNVVGNQKNSITVDAILTSGATSNLYSYTAFFPQSDTASLEINY